ncbi:peptidylprolyl isomerase [Patulibacter sp.]|uniref:peptidylprolyl isomerase n=1 Tax=Patulibacter sp. TaxID=1912859 RepID=UPI00272103C2|nr:peptidylprolyl isomerase [Patulibacter sp.]MDO9407035.1 peptidylprolyl isomerase [Patulibacter sp.]
MSSPSSSATSSAARRVVLLLATAAIVPGLAACGSDDDTGSGSTTASTEAATTQAEGPPETTTEAAPAPTCRSVEQPEPRSGEPDQPEPKPARLSGTWTVTMRTSCGSFRIRLDTARQPKTTASFKSLVSAGFYDGLTFHRIVPGTVVQGGDPLGTGTGDAGYTVQETTPADAAYTRGTVAMAKSSADPPGASSSQFFIVTAADGGYPPDYAIVGTVVSGMDVVDAIDAQNSGGDAPPVQPIVITKATAKKG